MKHEVRETTFAPRTYLVCRREIDVQRIADKQMWQDAFGKVHQFIQKHNLQGVGPGTALYFRWDQAAGKADLGIGNSVEGIAKVDDPELSLVPVTESEALHTSVNGDYQQLRDVHAQLTAAMAQRGWTPTLTVEEYTVMGLEKPDPKDWETNVYYLHG